MTEGITNDKDDNGVPAVAHIDLKKYGNELRDFFASKGIAVEAEESNFPGFEIKRSEEYTDAEILVYNSMRNAAAIIAKDLAEHAKVAISDGSDSRNRVEYDYPS